MLFLPHHTTCMCLDAVFYLRQKYRKSNLAVVAYHTFTNRFFRISFSFSFSFSFHVTTKKNFSHFFTFTHLSFTYSTVLCSSSLNTLIIVLCRLRMLIFFIKVIFIMRNILRGRGRKRWKVLRQKAFYFHHIIIAKVDVAVRSFLSLLLPSFFVDKKKLDRVGRKL